MCAVVYECKKKCLSVWWYFPGLPTENQTHANGCVLFVCSPDAGFPVSDMAAHACMLVPHCVQVCVSQNSEGPGGVTGLVCGCVWAEEAASGSIPVSMDKCLSECVCVCVFKTEAVWQIVWSLPLRQASNATSTLCPSACAHTHSHTYTHKHAHARTQFHNVIHLRLFLFASDLLLIYFLKMQYKKISSFICTGTNFCNLNIILL